MSPDFAPSAAPLPTASAPRAGVWTRYWAQGVAHSCAGSYDARLTGPIGDFWRQGLADLPAGGHVLDIAAGNGPLGQLFLQLQPSLTYDAVDLAQPAPQWAAALPTEQRQQVRFHGHTAAEALPFPAQHFDWVVSQWGLEYSALDQSVTELLRVLKPGGRVQLLCHHAGSLLVTVARQELTHIDDLLRPQGLLDCTRALLEPLSRTRTEAGRQSLVLDTYANDSRARFNEEQDRLAAKIDTQTHVALLVEQRELCNQALQLAATQGLGPAEAALGGLRQALVDNQLRLQELVQHALSETSAAALGQALAGSGSYALAPLSDRGAVLGWTLRATPGRPSPATATHATTVPYNHWAAPAP